MDIFGITETWLHENTSDVVALLTPPCYSIINVTRKPGSGGGIALVHKSNLNIQQIHTDSVSTFEKLECSIKLNCVNYTMVVIFRPPHSHRNGLTTFKQ